jgi:transmembrane sensor
VNAPFELAGDPVEQAAEWTVRLSAGDMSADEHHAFAQWQQADIRHAEAFARMSVLIEQLEQLRDGQGGAVAAHAALRVGACSRKGSLAKLAVMAVLLSATVGFHSWSPTYLMADLRTGTGEWGRHTLADHSRVTLNSDSAVNIGFNARERRLTLVQGEVLVDVARDSARPFIVVTEHGSIRALGTRFVVRRQDGMTRLLMLESKTSVQSGEQVRRHSTEDVLVEAGQAVDITATSVSAVQPLDARSVDDAWKFHQLVVQDRPLSEVLDELSRHRRGRILYMAQARDLRVSAVLPLDDTDQALQLLAISLPIRMTTLTPWLVRVQSAH